MLPDDTKLVKIRIKGLKVLKFANIKGRSRQTFGGTKSNCSANHLCMLIPSGLALYTYQRKKISENLKFELYSLFWFKLNFTTAELSLLRMLVLK